MPNSVTRLPVGPTGTFAERIAATQSRLFVGREGELAYFEDFVAAGSPQALWFIVGAGGIGKSALLRCLRARASEEGLSPVAVDARRVAPNPPSAEHALARAAGSASFAAYCRARERPLLFIDTFEYWQALEPWLREEFLPALPASLKLVVGSRTPPALDWRTHEGWRPLMKITELSMLNTRDCVEYLKRRGLEDNKCDHLIRFSGGHPLALAMSADSALSGREVSAAASGDDDTLIQGLVENFTREAQDADERRTMDACAVVREVNESLLAAMLDKTDASSLYEWLRSLAFIESGESGVFPHDIVREVLMREMPRRYPERYEALATAAIEWIVDRIEATESLAWAQAARLASDGMYALRALPVIQHFLQPAGTRSLYLDSVRAEDQTALEGMVLEHEGTESLRWFRFWRKHHPEAIYVVRDARETPKAFFLKLDVEALEPAARDADPLTRCLWQALCGDLALRPGEHVPFIRFWVTHDYAISDSPEKTKILMAIHTYNLIAKNLRLSAQVFDDEGQWEEPAAALGIHLVENSDTVIGGKNWRIYYNDWQRESPTRYYRRFAERCIGFQSAVAGVASPVQSYTSLSEAAFHADAIDALKHLHRPRAFARNPLLGSALVMENAGRGADAQACRRVLAEQVKAAIEDLAHGGGPGQRWRRILHRAYLVPARGQKETAAALNMGYSTFRRQLAEARNAFAAELWQREKAAR